MEQFRNLRDRLRGSGKPPRGDDTEGGWLTDLVLINRVTLDRLVHALESTEVKQSVMAQSEDPTEAAIAWGKVLGEFRSTLSLIDELAEGMMARQEEREEDRDE